MSIHFISGKPGGGKTLYSVRLIVDEILHGHRTIITNVPIKLGHLNEYLQKEFDHGGGAERVWQLDDEQTKLFWTFRPGGVRIPYLKKEEWQAGKTPDYKDVKDEGVMYVIDEVHNFFGARQWAETGRDVLFYLSQHRKLGDTVICITQAIGNVDKQFRSVTQDFTFVRNLSKERYGLFRLPACFIRKTFSSPPTDTSQPMESGTFTLDVSGLARCYDSAAGVGIHGRLADTKEQKKGMHWSVALGALAAIVLILFLGVPHAVGALFHTRGVARPGVKQIGPVGVMTNLVPVAGGISNGYAPHVWMQTNNASTNVVTVSGMAYLGGRCIFTLSDGQVIGSNDRRYQGFKYRTLYFNGVAYELDKKL